MNLHVVARSGSRTDLQTGKLEDTAPIREEIGNPNLLRTAIDGRELTVLGRRWRVEVFSASEISSRYYVQLALRGDPDHMLTLRVQPGGEIGQLIPRLLGWLTHPGARGEIVDVP